MLCGRLCRRGAAKLGMDWVPGTYVYWFRGTATSGFSTIIRARPLPSTGMTSYLPASTYQVPISSMSLSRCSAARLWFSAGSSSMW